MRHYLALLSVLVGLSACISTKVVRPEDLENDSSKDIVITTSDGRTIRMFASDYDVTTIDSVRHLRGKAQEFINPQRTQVRPLTADIILSEITLVETTEKTIFYYTGPILFGATAAFIVLVVIATGGRGPGG